MATARVILGMVLACLTQTALFALDVPESSNLTAEKRVTEFSLEDLMNVEVTSVSRAPGQGVFTSPAAIYVIQSEDIRRTGHQSLPELLRLVPGLHVAQIDAGLWAISSRGFNGRFNRNQLVQIDGRTVYNPTFAGVNWIAQDTLLEDLDRVEVIRGPGATLWGANAVNGIVNFETKSAKDTQGLLVSAVGGTEERVNGAVRFGGKAGKDLHYRIYAKCQARDHGEAYLGDYTDDWRRAQTGARIDWEASANDQVIWQGDAYGLKKGELHGGSDFPSGTAFVRDGEDEYDGWNAMAKWRRKLGTDHEFRLQIYASFDRQDRPHNDIEFTEDIFTFDFDYQHNRKVGRHALVWGLNYRRVDAEFDNGPSGLVFDPSGRTTHTVSGFVQDTIEILPDTFELSVGTKVEHNPFTNLEVQPSVRTMFKPHADHVLWTAVSRAVRVPAIFDNDARVQATLGLPGTSLTLRGNRRLDPEEVVAFEFGYRARPVQWFGLDLTAFHNRYRLLIDTKSEVLSELGQPFPPGIPAEILLQFGNGYSAKTYGVELAATWTPLERLRILASYTWLDVHVSGAPGDEDEERRSPANQAQARVHYDLGDAFEFNAALYYYDNVPAPRAANGISAFCRADLGFTWRPPVDGLEVSLWGTNLFDASHKEYGPDRNTSPSASRIQRGVFGKVTWRW
ncbi:MAG: TonB-dependent receptor plug domain-containing protein [Planctomycetes bacterium]|nr:TonB-dependent receptor plug domain-containing protein [Planctomycetota bacterium]